MILNENNRSFGGSETTEKLYRNKRILRHTRYDFSEEFYGISNIFKSLNVLKNGKAELSYFYKKSEVTI